MNICYTLMKNRLWLLSALSLQVVLSLTADTSTNVAQLSENIYAKTGRIIAAADTSTNVAILPANLIVYFEKNLGEGMPTNQFRADEMIYEVMTVRRTNLIVPHDLDSMTTMAMTNSVHYRGLSSFDQAIDFKMFDENGREVPKTEKGLAQSRPPIPPKNALDLHSHFKPGIAHWPLHDVHQLFRPSDMFVITNKGIYELMIKMRICVALTNGVPDTNAMTDSHLDLISEDFGVVESTPVRVKVIKE